MADAINISLSMNPYLFGCIILFVFWLFTFWRVRKRKNQQDMREFWWASFTCCFLGITEPLYVPSYWNPPSVLKFYRWDLESFIFCFAIGGVAAVFTELPKVKKFMLAIDHVLWTIFHGIVLRIRGMFAAESEVVHMANVTYNRVILTKEELQVENAILITFFLAMFGTTAQFHLNIIYDAAIVCLSTAGYIWWRRPRLQWQIVGGGLSFTLLYGVVLVVVGTIYPDFFDCWNKRELTRITIDKAPLEEYLFAFTFGALWAPLYEAWKHERYALPSSSRFQ